MRKRKAEMEIARKDWEKPLLKPGDTVALIGPRDGRECGQRILLVHRFWTEGEERGRNVFWVPGDIDLECVSEHASAVELCSRCDDFSTHLHREVVECKLWEVYTGARGGSKKQCELEAWVVSTLESHILSTASYFFWDGFDVAKGTSASGGAVLHDMLKPPWKSACFLKFRPNNHSKSSSCESIISVQVSRRKYYEGNDRTRFGH